MTPGSNSPLAERQPVRSTPGPKRLRVLIVDDSVVMRRIVTRVLEEIPEVEIAGSAANGRIALERIPQLKPDLLTLDIEMPEMDGLETVQQVRRLYPAIRIVMCSTLTQRGGAVTLDALSKGADDYVTKPTTEESPEASLAALRAQLAPKVRQFLRRSLTHPGGGKPAATTGTVRQRVTAPPVLGVTTRGPTRREVVAIAASTGGPVALSRVIGMLGADFASPILVVQHMPPMFTRLLADRLNTQTHLRVSEARDGDVVVAGAVLVAPGDFHMVVRLVQDQVVVALTRGAPENSCRPAADVLFRSVAEVYGARAMGVILTGMGHDGLNGLGEMRNAGACVIAQDEATSVVWGMPGAVVEGGVADKVVPLDGVAVEIERACAGRLGRPDERGA
jgi:two-component system chemotaxis response regulator CheB